MDDLNELELGGGQQASVLRTCGGELGIGYGNGKAPKRAEQFGISKQILKQRP